MTKTLPGYASAICLATTQAMAGLPVPWRDRLAILRRARILYLNYPNNPTGARVEREFFERALEFADPKFDNTRERFAVTDRLYPLIAALFRDRTTALRFPSDLLMDIDTPEDYERATSRFSSGR